MRQSERRAGNAYVDGLIRDSGLHIIREREVTSAYKERGVLGLFSLFFRRDFRDSLQLWTNKMLKEKGKPEATMCELDAYLGLEIAMSFNPVTEIKELWSKKLFMGQPDFAATMPRNRFEQIHVRFHIHAPGSVPVECREQDPLWHSRSLMAQVQEKFASIAVPVGAVSLDENTVRTKARSSARTYLPSNPVKYGVRFYAVVGWKSLYAYSMWNNDSGNRLRSTPAEWYLDVFPALRTGLFRTLEKPNISITRKDPSTLWVAMCCHLTKTHPAPTGHRRLVSDNFIRGIIWLRRSWFLLTARCERSERCGSHCRASGTPRSLRSKRLAWMERRGGPGSSWRRSTYLSTGKSSRKCTSACKRRYLPTSRHHTKPQ